MVATSVFAEAIPAGCYVADYYRTNNCWVPFDGKTSYKTFNNYSDSDFYYGGAVSSIVISAQTYSNANSSCINDYNNLVTDKNNLASQYNALSSRLDASLNTSSVNEANRQEWIVYGNAQAALVKKLKKACGAKCSKIK